MQPVYILKWDQLSAHAFTYGADITYPDVTTVAYANSLQPSGKPIYTWENLSAQQASDAGIRQSVVMPILEPDHTYHVQANLTATPVNSVGISVDFLDYEGHVMDRIVQTTSSFDFTFPYDAIDYRISIVKFNNEELQFDSILLAESDLFTTMTFETDPAIDAVVAKNRELSQSGQTATVLLKKVNYPVDTMYIDARFDEAVYLGMTATTLADTEQLKSYFEQVQATAQMADLSISDVEVTGIGMGTDAAVKLFRDKWQNHKD
ncbi:accessory Sec system protein Asp3 [uncultured Weissella sp.]|uniref:accessory Sec system protein Asp3 n=1 Tax=uncultured Weissella sp. TaxID=253243 RepID=UPI0027DAC59A|nr:accessory Sec system protein Asp3 [uncultured Weissella sp.]